MLTAKGYKNWNKALPCWKPLSSSNRYCTGTTLFCYFFVVLVTISFRQCSRCSFLVLFFLLQGEKMEGVTATSGSTGGSTSVSKGDSGAASEGGEDEDNLCAICCAYPVDTLFEPCHHSSCLKCIKRHLLNSDKCFFCNAKITSTVAITPGTPAK